MDLDDLLKDPPSVHEGIASGVWSTERSCYELIVSVAGPQSRTLETGLGISTALFASIGNTHTCVVPHQEEVDKLIAYCEEHGIDHRNVTFLVAPSDEVLPSLEVKDELDLVLIDGSHGYPVSVIDWYYGARHLRRGGVLIIDDLQLPQVQVLDGYLIRDPRWVEEQRTEKWVAYRRESEGSLAEEWSPQRAFFTAPSTRELFGSLSRSVAAEVLLFTQKVRWRVKHRNRP